MKSQRRQLLAARTEMNRIDIFLSSPAIAALSPVLDRFGRQRRPGQQPSSPPSLGAVDTAWQGVRFIIPKIERIQQDRLVVVIYIQATPAGACLGRSRRYRNPYPPWRDKGRYRRGQIRSQAVFAGIFGDDRRSDVAEVRRFATGGAARQGILSRRVPGKTSTGSTRYHDDSIRSAAASSFTGGDASAEANCLFLIGGRQRRDSESADSAACQYGGTADSPPVSAQE